MSAKVQEILLQANTAFQSINSNAGIKTILIDFGYDDAKLAAGQALFVAASAAQGNNFTGYGNQYSATEAFHVAREAARTSYMMLAKIARIALKDSPAAYNKIGLVGIREFAFPAFAAQVDLFYTNTLSDPALMAQLATFGITEAKITAGLAQFTTAKATYAKQQQEIGEARASTHSRDKAVNDLSRWMSDFMGVARIALKAHDLTVEELGI